VSGNTLQQVERLKYLGVVFAGDGSRSEEIGARTGNANAFCVSFIALWFQNESFQTPHKLSVFKSVFVPIHT